MNYRSINKNIAILLCVITVFCSINTGYCETYFEAYKNIFGGGLAKKYPNAATSRAQCEKLMDAYAKSYSILNGYDENKMGSTEFLKEMYCNPNVKMESCIWDYTDEGHFWYCGPEGKKMLEQKQKQDTQKYLMQHAALVKEINLYKKDLPNLDFKLYGKYKSTYNTLIKDTYAVFTGSKERFDMIQEHALFDANLNVIRVPGGLDTEYYLANYKKPVFIKYSVANTIDSFHQDMQYLRFLYIHDSSYKNPNFKPLDNFTSYNYFPKSKYGEVKVSDIKSWFEEYKEILAPYLSEYKKVKEENEKIINEEAVQYKKQIIEESKILQEKYADKTIGHLINEKCKNKLSIKYPENKLSSEFSLNIPLEQFYDLRIGHYYLKNGKEVSIAAVNTSMIKQKEGLFIDENLIKKIKKLAKIKKQETKKADNVDFSYYISDVESRIKRQWHPLSQDEFKIVVFLKIDKNGNLLSQSILYSSATNKENQNALNAVRSASPFKPLPSNYQEPSVDVEFTFSTAQNKLNEYKVIPLY